MKRIAILIVFIFTLSAQAQWVQISTVPTTQLNAVKFFDAYTGITVGIGGIWRSTNSGVNWTQVLSGVNLNAVSFPDLNTGYAVGDSGKIYKTINGGVNWLQLGIGLTSKNLNTVAFPIINGGWIMGQAGKILHTVNGGSSFFTETNIDTTRDINCLYMINASTGFFCGSSNFNEEVFGLTANGGINWLYSFITPGNTLFGVSAIPGSSTTALAVGTNGRIRRTTNNGINWTIIPGPAVTQYNYVVFLDMNTGYIAANAGVILKTTNSGFAWTVEPSVTGNDLKGVSFINPTTAWVVGSNGIVLRQGIPVGVIQNGNGMPEHINLFETYPNPFNPITKIVFEIPERSFISLIVYDILGREVEVLVTEVLTRGRYEVFFNGENASSGVYVCKLQVGNGNTKFIKMIMLK